MALLYVLLALAVPVLRNFYELSTLSGKEAVAWVVGTAIGVGGILMAQRLLHVRC